MVQRKASLLRDVAATSEYFGGRLARMQFPHPATIRRKGLAIAVELGKSDYVSKLTDRCRKARLLVSSEDKALLLFPALNVDPAVAKKGLDILEECL